MNYFEQFVFSVVVFKHVHWTKLSVCHFADGGLSTSAFPDKITTVVNVIPKLSGHDQASFQQKVIDWQLLKPLWEHLFSQDTNLSYLSFLLHN